ncbi:MAG: nucleotide exchange factor GrpE [Candidatus Nanopelagicales bacterium]|nr:nucleotide exchange factor GrpE [Candidatus Nanopelagicales bacterium]
MSSEYQNEDEEQGVRVTDKRRIDPDTYALREVDAQPESGEVRQLDEAGAPATDETDKLAELTNDLQRVQAEYANYRRRVDRDRELVKENAIGSVIAALLPVIDDIDRAREHGELEGAFRSVGEALEGALAKLGLEKFGTANEPFDPNLHEALSTESRDDISEPTVTALYQPGYRYAGRVLRPARVAVAGTD